VTSSDFYRLLPDSEAVTRWFLASPLDAAGNKVDSRIFTDGNPVNIQLQSSPTAPATVRVYYYGHPFDVQPPLTLPLRRTGDEVDFNFGDHDMVVTPRTFNDELESLVGGAIQRIPVTVEGKEDKYEIVNVCGLLPCVDEARTEYVEKWTADDGRPDRTGTYRTIFGLKIDPAIADGHHIFRIKDWPIVLIASGEVKRLLEDWKITGVGFERVDV